jgi:1-acyl-sn-glycerol-3-phosphate acyltransferase
MGALQAYAGLNNYAKSLVHHLEASVCSKTVCIFPVGRKHTAADWHEAKGGVMYLAVATDLPILPVKIEGIDKMGMRDFFLKRRKMRVTFGEPVSWQELVETKADRLNYDRDDYEQAARLLMRRINALN